MVRSLIHKFNLSFLSFIAIINLSYAQSTEHYKIISQCAQIKLYPESYKIEIIDTLKIINNDNTNIIKLKLNPIFKIDSVLQKQKPVKFFQTKEIIELKGDFGNESEVIIFYNGIFNFKTEFSELTDSNAILRDIDIFPLGTKTYQFIRLTIITPIEWEAVAIGKKLTEVVKEDKKYTVYENKEKVETVGWIVAGKYHKTHTNYRNIEIITYFSKERKDLNESIIQLTKKVLDFYENYFSKYRFPKLALIEVDDWLAGGAVLAAAYPSVILLKNRTFTTEDEYNHILSILPHEIAHQWWPLTNFVDENDTAFLSEGLCEYSSVLFKEKVLNTQTSFHQHPLLRSLIQKSQKGTDIPLNKKIDIRKAPTHYLKASYIHHMLRFTMGDSNYFRLLKSYAEEHPLQISNTNIFEKLATNVSKIKLDWFFNQWITKIEIPRLKIYNVKTEILNDTLWRTKGRVRQISYETLFTLPLEIVVKDKERTDRKIFWIGKGENQKYKNEIEFVFHTNFKPEEALLDPDGNILKWQKLPPKFSDLRDPSYGYMIIGTNCSNKRYSQLLSIARNDSLEITKAGWDIELLNDTSITLKHLQSRNIFIYGNASENKIAGEQVKHFPVAPQNYQVTINEVSYSDSFSFIQIIDNPYFDGGLISWIVPFSEYSNPVLLPYNASYAVINKSDIIIKGDWQVDYDDLRVLIK